MLRNSVQKRFFLISAPIALVVMLAVAAWNAQTGHDKQTARLNEKLEHLIQNQSLVMAEAMAARDKRLLKLVGAGIVADPDIVFVHIADQAGQTIASLGQREAIDYALTRQINIRVGGNLIVGGDLSIGVSYDAVRESSQRFLYYSGIGALVAVLAIWLGGFLAFRYAVGRPIDTLHGLIERWRNDQWVEPQETIKNDEFGALTSAFVELHTTVQTRESELQSIKDGLERRVAERTEELEKRALTDALTGLANRRAAAKFAEEKLIEMQNGGQTVCIFAIDLDRFKELNDQHGHALGDDMLCHAARTIEEHMGGSGLVARMGGDEFIAIALHSAPQAPHLEKTGQRLVDALSRPVMLDDIECQIGACIGIAVAEQVDQKFGHLLANADLALYDAKHAGRGRCKVFDEFTHTTYRHRRQLVAEVKEAIAGKEFEPYLQPQIDVESGRIVGFELLARWRRQNGKMEPPQVFLAAVEDAGLMAKLDEIILHKGLDALVQIHQLGHNQLRVSANASTASLQQPSFASNILRALKKRGLKPQHLVIEILEETVITDTRDQAMKTIEKLSKAGLGIEMDDFGAGYSSFSRLAMLPLDGLKIDRTLIDPLPHDASIGIVRAILAVCKELDLRVVSEGVETWKQLEILRELGCDMAQGYLLAKPMPVAKAIAWLNSKQQPNGKLIDGDAISTAA